MRRKDRALIRKQQRERPKFDRESVLRNVADAVEAPEIEMGLIKGGPMSGILTGASHALVQRLDSSGADINSLREEIARLTSLLIDRAREVAANDKQRAAQWQYKLACLLGMRPYGK